MCKHILVAFIFFQIAFNPLLSQNISIDSINNLILNSKNGNFNLNERLEFAQKSSDLAKKTKIDSIVLMANRNLSLLIFESQDYESYISLNRKNFRLGKQINDSSAVKVAGSNLGIIYRYFEKKDSSYYYYTQALKHYPPNEISEYKAEDLFHLAEILQVEKIYAAAEEAAIKSILLLNRLPNSENRLGLLWNAYNLLGIISRETDNYEKALEYYEKSSVFAREMEDGFINEVYSINNKAFVYRQMGDFDKAVKLYQSLLPLRSRYQEEDPSFYPTILTNIADTKLESGKYDFEVLNKMFRESYALTKKLNDEVLRMNVSLHISKLYNVIKEKDSIYKYANEALEISSKVSANEIKQEALLILSEITKGEKGKSYLREHIRLTDSLLKEGRNVRNKYARIKFETDQLEEENEKIEAKNKQISKENLYLAIVSIGLLLSAILIYTVISQRAKNRKLKLVQVQQTANEDIYNLMLGQQDKLDEARAKEKTRVSEELHDGVLGRLFGARLSLDSINFKDGKEAMLTRAKYIAQLQEVEQDIRKISHELNTDFVSGSGFMDILTELIGNQTQSYGLEHNFRFTNDISWDMVSNKSKINIYRIIQESMQNIYKHANATIIKISISLEKDVICLDIIDDGDGFDTSKSKKGIGLKNMTSRVEDINGEITVISEPRNGTKVNVKIPYTN